MPKMYNRDFNTLFIKNYQSVNQLTLDEMCKRLGVRADVFLMCLEGDDDFKDEHLDQLFQDSPGLKNEYIQLKDYFTLKKELYDK